MKAIRHKIGHGQALPLIRDVPSFYLFAESNPNPILITDRKGDVQYVNAAWERLTGYTSSEVCGKNPRFLQSGKTPPSLYKEVWGTLTKGESFEGAEFIDKRKDGSEFLTRCVFFPIKIRGAITYFVQELQDISEQKGLERQKDAFISIASHELRTPLSVIVLSLDLLKHELGAAPKGAMSLIKTLKDETGRLTSLLNNLLDVSKMQAGTLPMQKEEHDLEHLVYNVVTELNPIYRTHSLSIKKHGRAKLVAVYDSGRIAQVLNNLLSNAVKYSPQAGKVVVHLRTEANAVCVEVQDFGIGIGEEEQQKIFDIFYRANNRGSIKGTGLGLFIVAQIIAAHKGRLWVTSKLGKGSTFHFSLPLHT